MSTVRSEQITGITGRYGTQSLTTWQANPSYYIYSGVNGSEPSTYYRSRLTLSTAGLSIAKSSKLVVRIVTDQTSSPFGCTGVLVPVNSTTTAIKPSQAQDSTNTGPSAALSEAAIAISRAYKDPDGIDLSEKHEAGGTPFYFVFHTTELEVDKQYYIFLLRNTTSNCWVRGFYTKITATLHSYNEPIVYIVTSSGEAPNIAASIEDGSLVVTGYGTASASEGGQLVATADGVVASVSDDGVLNVEATSPAVHERYCVHIFRNSNSAIKHMPYIYNGTEWVKYTDNDLEE